MNYNFDVIAMQRMLEDRLVRVISREEWSSLQQRLSQFQKEKKAGSFNLTFVLMPRLIKKCIVPYDRKSDQGLKDIRHGFCIQNWEVSRLARSWWLLHWVTEDKIEYFKQINSLFRSAEVNEQVALYGSLPLFAYPDEFRLCAAEGLRTNIRQVFESIALNNPYPADYLDEAAWNQMVLKSFFMNVAVNQIIGLDQRANGTLAYILSDYAHERWSANRSVSPLLWRPVGKFLDERLFPDIEKLFQSEHESDKKAAALACAQSSFQLAKEWLQRNNEMNEQIMEGALTWESLEETLLQR